MSSRAAGRRAEHQWARGVKYAVLTEAFLSAGCVGARTFWVTFMSWDMLVILYRMIYSKARSGTEHIPFPSLTVCGWLLCVGKALLSALGASGECAQCPRAV